MFEAILGLQKHPHFTDIADHSQKPLLSNKNLTDCSTKVSLTTEEFDGHTTTWSPLHPSATHHTPTGQQFPHTHTHTRYMNT